MRIADIRSVIDAAAWRIRDLQGHTREEFVAVNVPHVLGEHIANLRALDIPVRFGSEHEQRQYQIGACERQIDRWRGMQGINNKPFEHEPSATTVYIVPAFSDQAGQCRIVARKGCWPDARDSYRESPGAWVEIGLMDSSGHLRCLTAPTKVFNELRTSEPLAAGNVFQFQP
ncbi:MAG: hypothetical protein EKK53_26665 [Burkholderiales bacterium]|nr:MAG: hypothetical protein EKK53_26665 [Burkholderiales bacterium]